MFSGKITAPFRLGCTIERIEIMTRKSITATSMSVALVLAAAFAAALKPAPVDAADPVEVRLMRGRHVAR